jgi:hypothetical protein
LIEYGDVKPRTFSVSKRAFIAFYIVGITAVAFKDTDTQCGAIFYHQCCRRFLETIPLLLLPSGTMNVLHFIYGVSYYIILGSHFNRQVNISIGFLMQVVFVLASMTQSIVHCLYMMEKAKTGQKYSKLSSPLRSVYFLTYLTELLIHCLIFLAAPDGVTFSNMLWVTMFAVTKQRTINL